MLFRWMMNWIWELIWELTVIGAGEVIKGANLGWKFRILSTNRVEVEVQMSIVIYGQNKKLFNGIFGSKRSNFAVLLNFSL